MFKDKILIVEDEHSICNFIAAILSSNDYDTITAASGSDAITMATSHCPDLILLDLGLPDMDGMDIIRAVRGWSNIPIVVISARNHERDKVEALDFIVKPVQYATFAMKLERAVGRFQAHRGKDIWICEGNSRRRLRTLDIKYVEVSHHNVIYHTVEGDYKAYDQLKNVCASLADAPFALCNRCFLVNLHYVTAIGDYSVTVAGEELQISRSKKKDFLKSLKEYLGGK